MSGIESRSAAIRRGTVENDRITRRCTGVAAGGFGVLRASAGRNPVNAVVRREPNFPACVMFFEAYLTLSRKRS